MFYWIFLLHFYLNFMLFDWINKFFWKCLMISRCLYTNTLIIYRFRFHSGNSTIFASNGFAFTTGNFLRYLFSGTGLSCAPGFILPTRFSSRSVTDLSYAALLASPIALISFLQKSWLKSFWDSLLIKFCNSWSAGTTPPFVFLVEMRSLKAIGSRGLASGTLNGFCGLFLHSIAKILIAAKISTKKSPLKQYHHFVFPKNNIQ